MTKQKWIHIAMVLTTVSMRVAHAADRPMGGRISTSFAGGPANGLNPNERTTSVASGTANVKMGYQFSNGIFLDANFHALTLGSMHDSPSEAAYPEDYSIYGQGLAAELGYRWKRLSMWGGYGFGSAREEATLEERDFYRCDYGHYYTQYAGLGFDLVQTPGFALQLTAEAQGLKYLETTLVPDIRTAHDAYLIQSYGLSLQFYPSTWVSGSTNSTVHFYCFDCVATTMEVLLRAAPYVGRIVTEGLYHIIR